MRTTPRFGRLLSGWREVAPRRARTALTEAILLAFVLVAFTRLHAAVGTDVAAATDNARALQSVERQLHLDIELATNRWLAQHAALIPPAVLVYRLYYAVLIGVLLWLFLRHADVYRRVRRTFVAMTGLALLVFWALPMSPPRFALAGVVDIVAEHDLLGSQASREANNFTALPSLHVGWSAWAAYAAWSRLRGAHPRAALLAWVFPIVMVADVFATGNHYVLDVIGSAVLLVASITIVRGWERLTERRDQTPTHR
jgi:PAP2 superfamily